MASRNTKIRKLAGYIKKNPNDSFSKFALALEFLKEDKLQRARVLFESIRENDPDYIGVYYHLGKLYEQLDQTEKSLHLYKKGIEVASNKNEERTVSELKEALQELKIEMKER